MQTAHSDKLLTETEAAERLVVAPRTLTKWRCTASQSLPFIRVGRRIRYRASDVEAYLEGRTVHPNEDN